MYSDLSMMFLKLTRPIVAIIAYLAISVVPALAHSAEQAFILLLPTDIYIMAGTLTVAATILLVALLGRTSPYHVSSSKAHSASLPITANVKSLLSMAILFWLVWTGFNGPRDPLGNALPLVIWNVWWIGFVATLPLIGNLWSAFNPWTGLYAIIAGTQRPPLRLPKSFDIWPGVGVFMAFHIFAIADIAPSDPARLATIIGLYWIATLVGMLLFGGPAWLNQVECFTILFRLLASLAPIQARRFGIPGWATHRLENIRFSHAAFCIVMLGAGSFDGLHETFWWLAQIGINPLEFPGRSAVVMTSTFGLIATCLTLGTAFTIVVWVGITLAGDKSVTLNYALPSFALGLIPIAFGYHVAHYLTSFLVGIQYSAIVLSDPFATGANYFGLAKLQVTTGFLNEPKSVKIIWLTQAATVVISHILAVIMAHATAVNLYQTRRQIFLVQFALSILMITYTIFGLWLLASPRGV